MSVTDEHGRPEPPTNANEFDTLAGYLEFQRSTLEWKTRGLDRAGLATTVARSSMTLGGILKHMAWVEEYWFSYRLHGRTVEPLWDSVDWAANPDWEWTSASQDSPDELRSLWASSVEVSRAAVDEALQRGGLDQHALQESDTGETPSLRWIITHMIEEYARHNGHADLLREAVDGEVGE